MDVPRIVVDTNVFLAAKNPRESESAAARALLNAVDAGRFVALVSVITLAELRSGFTAPQVPALWTPFLSHLRAAEFFEIRPVDDAIATLAGALRSELALSLPDALVCATAAEGSASWVATNDRVLLRARPPVPARRPSDLLRSVDG